MFNHLFATMLICLGVANTTPISNYNKKQEKIVLSNPKQAIITNNYTVEGQPNYIADTTYTTTVTTGVNVGNDYVTTVYDSETTYRLYGTSNYINILGNWYGQSMRTQEDGIYNQRMLMLQTKSKLDENDQLNWQYATKIGYMLKITPYNYNIDTTIRIKNYLLLETGYAFKTLQQIWLQRKVYTTTENWNEYIGLTTLEKNRVSRIENDITDINTGYFYNLDIENKQVGTTIINTTIVDEFDIQITPQTDNYIYIVYTPNIVVSNPTSTYYVEMASGNYDPGDSGKVVIQGTNIIPEGTYEMVDIPGLMFEILGMPFAFVSQAFNLTLFPGTPYQINIANLFLSIIAVFVFVWLLLLFIKMKSGK